MSSAKRNLNPHKAALVAMTLYCREYAEQSGGSMDFWDSLTESQKRTCREALKRIERAKPERP